MYAVNGLNDSILNLLERKFPDWEVGDRDPRHPPAFVLRMTCFRMRLAWTLVLLTLIIYSFGVALTEIVAQHCGQLPEIDSGAASSCPEELTKPWANVPDSMLSLFMAISQGLNWQDLVDPLLRVSAAAGIILIVYVIMTIFAILNATWMQAFVTNMPFCESVIF
eukprot:s403_g3.t1